MKITVYLALFGWPVLCLLFFLVMRPRRAMFVSLVLGWLLMPMAWYKFPSLPLYTRATASCGGALLGVLLFDLRRVLAFRFRWQDLPITVWCLSGIPASITNDLGFQDGVSSVYFKAMLWGVPYFLGRLYCSDLAGMFELAGAVFLGGLFYIPACLFEIRMSPQLHALVYGFHQHEFDQTVRFGGWRPMVFLEHGLMVSLWMCMAALVGIWLYYSRSLRRLGRFPLLWLVVPLAVTAVLCKSLGALVLLSAGVLLLVLSRMGRLRLALVGLVLLPPLYFAVRIPRVWSGAELTDLSAMVDPGRASSLRFRLINEDMLVDRALIRPVFGWGGWGRARVHDAMGQDITVTDGLWIIAFGNEGLVGLGSLTALFFIPLLGLWSAVPGTAWKHPIVAPAVVMCVTVEMFFIDSIFNCMVNPVYLLAAGGLSCLTIGAVKRAQREPAPVKSVA